MKKRAQFYLVAAIMIIGIIIILATVTNYIVTKKKQVKIYDLSDEFKEESARVMDYSVYNSEDIYTVMESLKDNYFVQYSEEKNPGSELSFVYGDKSKLYISTYSTDNTGEVTLDIGASSVSVTGADKFTAVKDTIAGPIPDKVKVELLGQIYEFDIHQGENFLFVISNNLTDEMYITRKS